jgi:aminoglycoside phosphotransferase
MATKSMTKFPAEFADTLAGYASAGDSSGWSGASVQRYVKEGAADLFWKCAPKFAGTLYAEKVRYEWLEGKLPVPRVAGFASDETHEHLLLTAIAGTDASEERGVPPIRDLVLKLADGLNMLHALPLAGCPFDHRADAEISAAVQNTAWGLVDESDFNLQRQGRSAASLLEELHDLRPRNEDLVFTHGDYCLPNIILDGGKLSGFVDMGRAGVGDRHRDLALAARSLEFNYGGRYVDRLFDAYGMQPDPEKMKFCLLLDEFF